MLTIHHLRIGRSIFTVWLLEELGQLEPYPTLGAYLQRNQAQPGYFPIDHNPGTAQSIIE